MFMLFLDKSFDSIQWREFVIVCEYVIRHIVEIDLTGELAGDGNVASGRKLHGMIAIGRFELHKMTIVRVDASPYGPARSCDAVQEVDVSKGLN